MHVAPSCTRGQPVSPALPGGGPTTGPGGKPPSWLIINGPKLDGAISLESLHSECQTGILAS